MALKQTIQLPTGQTAEYPRIESHTCHKNGDVSVKLGTYVTAAAAAEGKSGCNG